MCSCVNLDPLSVLDKVPSSQADGYQPFLGNGSTITVNNVVMGSDMVSENLGPFLTCIWSLPAGPGNATDFIILIFRRLRQRGSHIQGQPGQQFKSTKRAGPIAQLESIGLRIYLTLRV